jgi:hypothetical protein
MIGFINDTQFYLSWCDQRVYKKLDQSKLNCGNWSIFCMEYSQTTSENNNIETYHNVELIAGF